MYSFRTNVFITCSKLFFVARPNAAHKNTYWLNDMDAFTDSGELYSIRNEFYTNQHNRVKNYLLDSFSAENQLKVLEFQIRLTIALGEDASQLISSGKSRFPDNDGFFQLLEAYNDLSSFGTDSLTYFDDVKEALFELEAVLTALYLVKYEKDFEQATKILNGYIAKGTPEFEPYLLLVQLHLVQIDLVAANKTFNELKKFNMSDDIVYSVIESWINALRGESENINNSFYFYDELLSTDFEDDNQLKFRILNVLFVLTLQLQHYPEATELLSQIESIHPEVTGDFVANQIAYDYLVNFGSNVPDLLTKLRQVQEGHRRLTDLEEKSKLFDDIAVKYA